MNRLPKKTKNNICGHVSASNDASVTKKFDCKQKSSSAEKHKVPKDDASELLPRLLLLTSGDRPNIRRSNTNVEHVSTDIYVVE